MADIDNKSSEAAHIEDWAGEMGARWLANIDQFESMIAPIGDALLARADYREGERVVDIGCGGGTTSLAIAAAVGPSGSVVGLDISPDLIAKATERASTDAIANARFQCIDAAAYTPEAPYDRLFSRFGSMFFAEPGIAFANLHSCLKPGGRIDLSVWGPPRDNLWMMEMMGVLRRHVDVPPAIPRAPGPFAFEDIVYLQSILTKGGFTNMQIVPYSGLQPVAGQGASPEDALAFAMSSLAAGRLLEGAPQSLRHSVEKDLLALYSQNYRPGQGVMMACKAWLVAAQA